MPQKLKNIQQLRAVCILLVVCYHVWPTIAPYGYVGVDLFFVISGFSLFYSVWNRGDYNWVGFLLRRVRKIFLPLALIVLISIVASLLFDYRQTVSVAKEGLYGLIFLSNFKTLEAVGYFGLKNDQSPLYHLWSISVEEQLYIFFALFLLVVSHGRQIDLKRTVRVVIALSVTSFILAEVTWVTEPEGVFYSPVYRFWEFGLGVVSSIVYINNRYLQCAHKKLLKFCVLVIFFVSIAVLGKKQGHPFLLLMVCFALVITINFNINFFWKGWSKCMAILGDASYSIYLVHLPLIFFENFLNLGISNIFVFVLIFVIGILFYRLIETRVALVPAQLSRLLWIIAFYLLVLVFALYAAFIGKPSDIGSAESYFSNTIETNHLPFHSKIEISVSNVSKAFSQIQADESDIEFNSQNPTAEDVWDYPSKTLLHTINGRDYRIFGPQKNNKTLFISDSNVMQYLPRVMQVIKKDSSTYNTALFASYGRCEPFSVTSSDYKRDHLCDSLIKDVRHLLSADKSIKKLVIAASWNAYFNTGTTHYLLSNGHKLDSLTAEETLDLAMDLTDTIRTARRNGVAVYFVDIIPKGQTITYSSNYKDFLDQDTSRLGLPLSNAQNERIGYQLFKKELFAANPDLAYIDPFIYLCDTILCSAFRDNEPIYKDAGHLSAHFVKYHANFIDRTLLTK